MSEAAKKVRKNPPVRRNTYDLSPVAQKRRLETCRARIGTDKIIQRLEKHAMGKVQMTPTQVQAASVLLRKTVPDMVGVKAEIDVSPVVFNFNMQAKKE
jgi:hypothetical protein